MKHLNLGMLVFSLAIALGASSARAEMPSRLNVGGYQLTLNGTGSRTKSLIQLYEAGLYLPGKTANAASIVAADVPMAIRIKITSIFVSQESLVAALNDGFHKSTGGNTASIQREIHAFRQCFSEKITKGDVFEIAYIPTDGIVVKKNGRQKGIIKGLAFKRAVFAIWLGASPADSGLKDGVLGK